MAAKLGPFAFTSAPQELAWPTTAKLVFGALVLYALVVASVVLIGLVAGFPMTNVVGVVAAVAVALGLFGLTFLSFNRGWRGTSALFTYMALGAVAWLRGGPDVWSLLAAAAGLVMGIAVWTPSARAYLRGIAAARRQVRDLSRPPRPVR